MNLSSELLHLDTDAAIDSISTSIRQTVHQKIRRKGAIVALSGGIDSSVCSALCVNALGRENVVVLLLPDRDSSPESLELGRLVAGKLGVRFFIEDITPFLEAAGCYRRQEEAIREVCPEYGTGWKNKIVLPSILAGDRLNIPRLVVHSPSGEQVTVRLNASTYLALIAATNFKQRTRTMFAYYFADRLNYAVCGTPNRLEYDQGFFVKGGDGSADFKPIAHLYKTQVYALGRALNIPAEICNRLPTTDTFSLPQTQEEFFFALPYGKMDVCLYGYNHGMPTIEVAAEANLTKEQVERVYKDIEAKRRATLPLHLPPLLMEPVPEVDREVLATMAYREES